MWQRSRCCQWQEVSARCVAVRTKPHALPCGVRMAWGDRGTLSVSCCSASSYTLKDGPGPITCIAVNEDGSLVAVARPDKSLSMVQASTGSILSTWYACTTKHSTLRSRTCTSVWLTQRVLAATATPQRKCRPCPLPQPALVVSLPHLR